MYCSECGAKNEKDALFCEECGAKLEQLKEEKTPKKKTQKKKNTTTKTTCKLFSVIANLPFLSI